MSPLNTPKPCRLTVGEKLDPLGVSYFSSSPGASWRPVPWELFHPENTELTVNAWHSELSKTQPGLVAKARCRSQETGAHAPWSHLMPRVISGSSLGLSLHASASSSRKWGYMLASPSSQSQDNYARLLGDSQPQSATGCM